MNDAILTQLNDAIVDGSHLPGPTVPGPDRVPTLHIVDPHEVEVGDLLAEHPRRPIGYVYFEGASASWLFYSLTHTLIARTGRHQRVHVIRHNHREPAVPTVIDQGQARADVQRLTEGLVLEDRRFTQEAIELAREAFAHYKPRVHKLSHLGGDERQPGEISYPAFFRLVARDTFARTRNVGAAAKALDLLIAGSETS